MGRTTSGGEENRVEPQKVVQPREFPRNVVPPPNKKFDHQYGQNTRVGERRIQTIQPTQIMLRPQGSIPAPAMKPRSRSIPAPVVQKPRTMSVPQPVQQPVQAQALPGTYRTRGEYTYEFKRKALGEINPRFRTACTDSAYIGTPLAAGRIRANTVSAPLGGVRPVSPPVRTMSSRPRARTAGYAHEVHLQGAQSPTRPMRSNTVGSFREVDASMPKPSSSRFQRPTPRITAPRFGGPRALKVDSNGNDIRPPSPKLVQAPDSPVYEQNVEATLALAQRASLSDIREATPQTFDCLKDTVKLLNEWMHEIELEG